MDTMEHTPVSPYAHCLSAIEICNERDSALQWHSVEVVDRHLRTLKGRHPLDSSLYVQCIFRPHLWIANTRNAASGDSANRLAPNALTASVLIAYRTLL